jgi:TetR/AcrR family acrAB operon transcriptional repressor
MARKTKTEALATKNQILDAAEQMFCARGVARTSLHEIAASIGLTRGAIYWHFSDKYDLLAAMWERCMLPIEAAFDEIDAELAADPLGRVRAKAHRILHRITHDQRTQNLLTIVLLRCEMVDEVGRSRDHMLNQREECLAKVGNELRAAIAAGQLPNGTAVDRAAIGLIAVIDGLAYHWLRDPKRFELERVGGMVVDGYLCGLVNAPATRRPATRPVRRKAVRA